MKTQKHEQDSEAPVRCSTLLGVSREDVFSVNLWDWDEGESSVVLVTGERMTGDAIFIRPFLKLVDPTWERGNRSCQRNDIPQPPCRTRPDLNIRIQGIGRKPPAETAAQPPEQQLCRPEEAPGALEQSPHLENRDELHEFATGESEQRKAS